MSESSYKRRTTPVESPGGSDGDRGTSGQHPWRDPLFVPGLAVLAIGLALRLWILGRSPLNSDEAFVALMAREVLRGHFFVFLWGQHYGGGEFYVVAGLFALFGQSRFVLGLAPVLLDAAAAVLVWRIGRRLFDGRVGALAAIMFWIWPAAYVYLSTLEYGFRYLALVCGLAVVLFALRVTSPKTSRVSDWLVLGVFSGLGWWCTPEIGRASCRERVCSVV